MTFRLIPLAAVALAACSDRITVQNDAAMTAAANAVVAAAADPAPRPMATPFASPAKTLPKPLLGAWTADKTGDCASDNVLRIDISPDHIDFYESRARIVAVTQVDPHSWDIDATVTGEGETRRARFDLNLNEDERGTMTRVETPLPDITYSRCPKGAK